MNASRLSQLYRSRGIIMASLAAIDAQIAEAYAEDEPAPAAARPAANKAAPRARRHARHSAEPAGVTDTDVAAARAAAQRRGVHVP